MPCSACFNNRLEIVGMAHLATYMDADRFERRRLWRFQSVHQHAGKGSVAASMNERLYMPATKAWMFC